MTGVPPALPVFRYQMRPPGTLRKASPAASAGGAEVAAGASTLSAGALSLGLQATRLSAATRTASWNRIMSDPNSDGVIVLVGAWQISLAQQAAVLQCVSLRTPFRLVHTDNQEPQSQRQFGDQCNPLDIRDRQCGKSRKLLIQ